MGVQMWRHTVPCPIDKSHTLFSGIVTFILSQLVTPSKQTFYVIVARDKSDIVI